MSVRRRGVVGLRAVSSAEPPAAATSSLGQSDRNSCTASEAFALIKRRANHMRRCDRNATFSIYFLMGAPVVQLRLPSLTGAGVPLVTAVPSSADRLSRLSHVSSGLVAMCLIAESVGEASQDSLLFQNLNRHRMLRPPSSKKNKQKNPSDFSSAPKVLLCCLAGDENEVVKIQVSVGGVNTWLEEGVGGGHCPRDSIPKRFCTARDD